MGKCYYINIGGLTLQGAQTVCSSAFGSNTSGIVFEPATLAINDAVLQAASKLYFPEEYWIGVNNGNLTYHSNGNPVSIASIPWSSGQPNSEDDCVYTYPTSKLWYSQTCDQIAYGTICEVTSKTITTTTATTTTTTPKSNYMGLTKHIVL